MTEFWTQAPVAMAGLPQPGRTVVMGVINVTPDSFSDGGMFFDPDTAIQHGRQMIADGADIIDVGGESTRPGSERVSQQIERERVLPVVEALAGGDAVVSIDTMRAAVARDAVGAGAGLVNDVSGGQADPDMFVAVADMAVPYVLMHWRGHGKNMDRLARYTDVVGEVSAELTRQVEQAQAAGIAEERLILDPGLGFAKTGEHNWELLQHLDALTPLGRPLLLGASRKRFLGSLLAGTPQAPRPAAERDHASAALTWWAAQQGVWGVRVHAVRPSVDGLTVLQRLQRPG